MLLAYLDESYDKEEYWIAALVVPADDSMALTRKLDNVATDVAKTWGLKPKIELHGNALVQAKDGWKPLQRMHRVRIGIYQDAYDAIAATSQVKLLLQGLDRPAHRRRYTNPWHSHTVVLEQVLQKLNRCAASLGQHVLVIADDVGDHSNHRKNLWKYQHVGTNSYWDTTLDNIADTIHFAPSCDSRLLQAADLVSYLHFRMRRTSATDERARRANETLWSTVEPLVQYRYFWQP